MEVVFAELAEDPGSVVFELEIILSGGCQFVTDAVRDVSSGNEGKRSATYISNEYLWQAVKSSSVSGRRILA